MAESIKKLKYEPGDPVDTSSHVSRCPNGHPVKVHVTRKAGAGRVVCSQCEWSDRQQVIGATPLGGAQQPTTTKPNDPRNPGVTVMSSRGIENRRRPNIVSR